MDLPNQLLLFLLLITSGQGLVVAFIIGLPRPRHRSFYFLTHFPLYTVVLPKLGDRECVKDEAGVKFKWNQSIIPVLSVSLMSWAIFNFIGTGKLLGCGLSCFLLIVAMVSISWFGYSFLLGIKGSFMAQLKRSPGHVHLINSYNHHLLFWVDGCGLRNIHVELNQTPEFRKTLKGFGALIDLDDE